MSALLDIFEYYYVKNIRKPEGPGIRFTRAYKEQRRLEEWWCRMQIQWLNWRLRRAAK